ncbi:hypothetical protein VMCG_04917 [Cytospora schulzeri]|uniref:Uncharacterized protein n=1 Tax=Cytospora schulzeri TaxID=448051 RepID=A0A423WN97_9PEZI|nr:hypothetical protein VMCG_04917 [Valsa malicola]
MNDGTDNLIFQLQLEDLQEISSKLKGKQRAGEISDLEHALNLQRIELESSIRFKSDRQMCKSIANAVLQDGKVINVLKAQEDQAAADRTLALRSRGGNIPPSRNTGGARQGPGSKTEGRNLDDDILQQMAAFNIFDRNNDNDCEGTQPESSTWGASRANDSKHYQHTPKIQCTTLKSPT